jgi:hypothetical protein
MVQRSGVCAWYSDAANQTCSMLATNVSKSLRSPSMHALPHHHTRAAGSSWLEDDICHDWQHGQNPFHPSFNMIHLSRLPISTMRDLARTNNKHVTHLPVTQHWRQGTQHGATCICIQGDLILDATQSSSIEGLFPVACNLLNVPNPTCDCSLLRTAAGSCSQQWSQLHFHPATY